MFLRGRVCPGIARYASAKLFTRRLTVECRKTGPALAGLRPCEFRGASPIQTSANVHSVVINHSSSNRFKESERDYSFRAGLLLLACSGAAIGLKAYLEEKKQGQCAEKLPAVFSREDVAAHNTLDKGVYVIYKNNVYDITSFIPNHPGGSQKIILAAGGDLEPFWDMYAVHKTDEVLEILSEFRIGELREEDRQVGDVKKVGPFANDPKRHPALVVCSKEPFNAETPPALAVDSFITPNDLFFVRNHLPVPEVDAKSFRLLVEAPNAKTLSLTLDELKTKYKKRTIVAALQCAGNRRGEMNPIKQVKGLTWGHNAISNAEWGGVLLRDVLIDAGVNPDDEAVQHIQFEGMDKGIDGAPYGASIPADRVFRRSGDILIAYEMNGQPLPRDHGFPLRIVAPGIVGARNVKWLTKIVAGSEESRSHWQQNDYKSFSPNIDWGNVDFSKVPAMQELPVTSAICQPSSSSTVQEGDLVIPVHGYAYSGGGQGILRVDVSCDGGRTWISAKLLQSQQKLDRMYSWTLWEASVPIPENHGNSVELVCKATDFSCNTQPENVGPVWNLRGVANNSWHRVKVNIGTDEQ